MKELITRIAKALVDNPDQVLVSEVEGNQTTVLELKVAKEDLGKVIGKEGRNARAMRTILGAAVGQAEEAHGSGDHRVDRAGFTLCPHRPDCRGPRHGRQPETALLRGVAGCFRARLFAARRPG